MIVERVTLINFPLISLPIKFTKKISRFRWFIKALAYSYARKKFRWSNKWAIILQKNIQLLLINYISFGGHFTSNVPHYMNFIMERSRVGFHKKCVCCRYFYISIYDLKCHLIMSQFCLQFFFIFSWHTDKWYGVRNTSDFLI